MSSTLRWALAALAIGLAGSVGACIGPKQDDPSAAYGPADTGVAEDASTENDGGFMVDTGSSGVDATTEDSTTPSADAAADAKSDSSSEAGDASGDADAGDASGDAGDASGDASDAEKPDVLGGD